MADKKRKAYKTHAELIRTITSAVTCLISTATFIIVLVTHGT